MTRTATRDRTYNVHGRLNEPQFTVRPNEEFIAETELCTGGWLHSLGDTWTPEKTCALNPCVCVAVEGAKPGNVLAVHILDIQPDTLGYTGFDRDLNPLARRIAGHELPTLVKTVEIRGGFVLWDGGLRIPVRPMLGTLGTSPAEETLSNAKGGPHGGNMDAQEAEAGSTVYLPVAVHGALLHIGDAHAVQGDGEINCSGGVECRAVIRLFVDVLPAVEGMQWPRIENHEHICTVACSATAEDAFDCATGEMLRWLTLGYGMDEGEAYLLMGQVLEARCTQFVNPTRTYVCKVAKKYLPEPVRMKG